MFFRVIVFEQTNFFFSRGFAHLVDNGAVVEIADQVLAAGSDQGVLDGAEEDAVQLLRIVLLQLLQQMCYTSGHWDSSHHTQIGFFSGVL